MTAVDERPAIVAGVGVTMFISDCPDPVFGVVVDVYTDAIGDEAAEIEVPGRKNAHQVTRLLKVVRPAVAS